MSDYLDQMRIIALEKYNSELLNEKSKLQSEINKLKYEVQKLAENPDYINHIKQQVKNHEQRERELKERILSISKETTNKEEKLIEINKILSTDNATTVKIVADAMTQVHDKQKIKSNILSFILGVCASVVAWFITEYVIR